MRSTNWYVVTGAPCSGKTSAICELERMGYRVVHEVARAYIDDEMNRGKSLARIKADVLAFERHILYEKIEIEASLPDKATIFLDRAIPDSIAYFKLEGLDPTEPIEKSHAARYQKIFFFERLKFEKDAVRSEDDIMAARLDHLLKKSYQRLDYEIIQVPLLPVEKRVDFILEHL